MGGVVQMLPRQRFQDNNIIYISVLGLNLVVLMKLHMWDKIVSSVLATLEKWVDIQHHHEYVTLRSCPSTLPPVLEVSTMSLFSLQVCKDSPIVACALQLHSEKRKHIL